MRDNEVEQLVEAMFRDAVGLSEEHHEEAIAKWTAFMTGFIRGRAHLLSQLKEKEDPRGEGGD